MSILTSLVVKLVGDISEFTTDMDSAAAKLSDTGKSMTQIGQGMTKNMTLPLVGAAGASLYFSTKFNAGMANVASLGQEAQDSVANWKPLVQDMAISVGKSTDDMTEGLYNVVSAFGVADDTLEVLDINARAATAGLSTVTEAIDLTSAVTKAYGDTSAEAVQKVSDLALTAVQLGQTTFPELASSVGLVTPLMNELGGSQEELFAVMATATGVTGGASQVATQLRGVLQSLMAPTGAMADLMSDLGFESGQAMIDNLGLHGAMTEIVKAAEAAGQPLQKYIGSIEGQTLALALTGAQADTYAEKLEAMSNAAGATDMAFAAQTDGINKAGFAMQQARVQAAVWAQQIGDELIPVVSRFNGNGQATCGQNNRMDSPVWRVG
jgi:TP901 family phage tail tape measure protein